MLLYYKGVLLGSVVWQVLGNGPNIHLGDTFTNPNLREQIAAEDPLLQGLSDTDPNAAAVQLRSRIIAMMYAKVAPLAQQSVEDTQRCQILLIAPPNEVPFFDGTLKFLPIENQLSGNVRIASGSNPATSDLLLLQKEQYDSMAVRYGVKPASLSSSSSSSADVSVAPVSSSTTSVTVSSTTSDVNPDPVIPSR